jgi:predicted P-loop ATPase/GTPase
MARIAGLNYEIGARGQIRKVTFDLRKLNDNVSSHIEDIIDLLEIEALKNEATVPGEDVFKRLDRKHGIKTKELV